MQTRLSPTFARAFCPSAPRIGRPRVQCNVQSVARTSLVLPDDTATWSSFSTNVCGEWEGVTATFSPTGEPQMLPENFVPEAFREWGVELRDWQSQCSSITTDEPGAATSRQLKSVLRRLMPTVGCEADAIAFTEEPFSSRDSGSDTGTGNTLLLAAADGTYSTGPLSAPAAAQGMPQLQVEHCFVLPTTTASPASPDGSPGPDRFRVKVVQKFRRNWGVEGAWQLAEVDLHKERYDGPFTGKRELAGCGGGQPGIALLPPLEQQRLSGRWSAVSGICYSLNPATGQLESSSSSSSSVSCLNEAGAAAATSSGSLHVALLPLGAWSAVQMSASGRLMRAEAGVALEQQQQGSASSSGVEERQRLVSVRSHDADDGRLLVAALVEERSPA